MLLRGTAIVSVLTLLSRLLGFVRDLLVARLLGASLFADAFFVAFRIPNLLRSFVAEGALTSAFTPVFSQALTRGKEHANDSFKRIAGFLIAITSLITAAIILFAVPLVDLLAPGYRAEPGKFEMCVKLTRIMAPYIICVSLIAMLNAALNTLKVFGASAWAQVIMNVTLIIGALIAIPYAPE
ncbi:MAG: murein biosynthesis integral membrane protein MurJ, partial [Pseudomonadota bacterium]